MSDVCRYETIDDEPVRIRDAQPLTAEDREALAGIIHAAKENSMAELARRIVPAIDRAMEMPTTRDRPAWQSPYGPATKRRTK